MTRVSLPLAEAERLALRRARVRLDTLAEMDSEALAHAAGLAPGRARQLVALAAFQLLPSIGPATAADLWKLGYRRVEQLRGEDPRVMKRRLEEVTGLDQDPCVEDVFACAIYAAEHGAGRTPPWWEFSRRRLSERV